jgi:2-polyprenyl-6-methoxyphenol hydroxylase-like FAD-dependent oxidoreductase
VTYDAIVVGARCGGAATALLLGRQGRRVLLVDKATFPSDTLSTHFIHASGASRLQRWGLLARVLQSSCPPISTLQHDFGTVRLRGTPPPLDGVSLAIAPRRYVLDQILLEAALEAGVEWREAFKVDEVLIDNGRAIGIAGAHLGGATVREKCDWLIGADGRHSRIAELVRAQRYHERPPLTCLYYSYWSGVEVTQLEAYIRERRVLIAFPTTDGMVVVLAIWPVAQFAAVRAAVEREFDRALDLAPALAERVRSGRREEKFFGTADLPNFLRTASGDGWALVGDAGCHKDPILAQGISDAFRDAELLASTLGDSAAYAHRRDERTLPMYELSCQRASLEPPPPPVAALLGALAGNQADTNRFLGVDAGTVPVAEFYSPENIARIIARHTPSVQTWV